MRVSEGDSKPRSLSTFAKMYLLSILDICLGKKSIKYLCYVLSLAYLFYF